MPLFKQFSIQYYRAFKEKQQLAFGKPDADKEGSGITYLVGSNNVGKTTLLEAMTKRKDDKLKSSERTTDGEPIFELVDFENNVCRKVELLRAGSSTFKEAPELAKEFIFQLISSRRHWDSAANSNVDNTTQLRQSGLAYNRSNQEILVSGILKNIEKDNAKYEPFINFVRQVIPEFTQFTIGYEDQEYVEYVSASGVRHKSDILGDGVISIIRILAHLFEHSEQPLIIDEPELSLHPSSQKKLHQMIGEASKKRQIIISTHSPYFISWEYIKNGATLNRVVKQGDIKSEIKTLKDYGEYKGLVEGGNWQQPFLLDVVAKEIFFSDNFLFLEGQEDVGLLKPYFTGTDVNLFGYGVRGFNGYEFGLKLAADLGITKAAVILDSPLEENKHKEPNENSLREKLTHDYPDYRVIQWNKSDIRDKEPREVKAKTGYFTEKGKIKPDGDLEDFNAKIAEVKQYFNG